MAFPQRDLGGGNWTMGDAMCAVCSARRYLSNPHGGKLEDKKSGDIQQYAVQQLG